MHPQIVTRKELADIYKIHPKTIDRLVARGVLPRPIRFSAKSVRFDAAEVQAALAGLK
jgi:predicted DNA-binding transcriptional regulator AlpA